MRVVFGPPKTPETTPFISRKGKLNNVSYLDPLVVEISFYRYVHLERFKMRRVAPLSNYLTYITVWSKDPDDVDFDADLHEVCKFEFAPNEGGNLGLDDLLTGLSYISDDGVDKIWLTVAPENGSSNYYVFQITGRKETADSDSVAAPIEITVP